MVKKLHILGIGLLSALSAAFVSAYDGCYDYCGPDCGTFGVKGEYLFWTAKICDQDYAREYLASVGDFEEPLSILDDKIHQAGYKWCSGFRVGLDYQCSFDDPWRYSLVYTYFRDRDTSSASILELTPPEEGQAFFLEPTIEFAEFVTIGDFTLEDFGLDRATSHTRLRLDLGDLEIIRTTPLCGPACFNILLGVRGGYISNRWRTNYYFPDESSTSPVTNVNAQLINNWRYSCVGPRVGGQFDWCLGCGFSLYIDASLSGLWGKARNRVYTTTSGTTDAGTADEAIETVVLENRHPRHYRTVLMADAEAGLAFNWTCESFMVQGKVGVELLHFNSIGDYGFHIFPSGFSQFGRCEGNLDLYGLTAGLGIMF